MAHLGKPKQTAKGTAYPVKWRDPDGRFRERWVYGKREALKAKAGIEADLARGAYHDDRAGRITFREVAEEWLATRTKARPQTVDKYRRMLEVWVYPKLGARRINTIRPADLGHFVNGLKGAPLANGRAGTLRPTTIRRIWWPVHAVFDFAADHEYVRRSPATNIDLPDNDSMSVEPFEGRALTWAEVERIAVAAEWTEPVYGLVIRFLAHTGLRASELSGLRVGDVTPDGVRVQQTVSRDSREPGGLRRGAPKSKTSRRTVALSSEMAADVRAYLADHPRRHVPDAPLFPSRWSTAEWSELRTADPFNWDRPIDPGTFRRRVFDPACVRAGVGKVRLHDLRHTCGSLSLAAGMSLFAVSRRLGHSSPDFTARVYGHEYRSSAQTDAEALSAFCSAEASVRVVPLRSTRVG